MITLARPFYLASSSPRRAELLAQIGLRFQLMPTSHEEVPPGPGEDLACWARQAALDKARAVTQRLASPALILGADTVVAVDSDNENAPCWFERPVTVLGKPVDAKEAREMLMRLSGRVHSVISAFALLCHPEGAAVSDVVETRVHFRNLTDCEIERYIATGEPMDKAGAYGIQGMGAVLVDRIEGDYNTVVGLPLARLWQALLPWSAGEPK